MIVSDDVRWILSLLLLEFCIHPPHCLNNKNNMILFYFVCLLSCQYENISLNCVFSGCSRKRYLDIHIARVIYDDLQLLRLRMYMYCSCILHIRDVLSFFFFKKFHVPTIFVLQVINLRFVVIHWDSTNILIL